MVSSLRKTSSDVTYSAKVTTVKVYLRLFKRNGRVLYARSLCNKAIQVFRDVNRGEKLGFSCVSASSVSLMEGGVEGRAGTLCVRAPDGPAVEVASFTRVEGLTSRFKLLVLTSGAFLSPCFRGPLRLNTSVMMRDKAGFLKKRGSILTKFIYIGKGRLSRGLHCACGAINYDLSPFSDFLILQKVGALSIHLRHRRRGTGGVTL